MKRIGFILVLCVMSSNLFSKEIGPYKKNSIFVGGEYHYVMNAAQVASISYLNDQIHDTEKYIGKGKFGGGHSGGGYIGIETRDKGSWVSMLNTFTLGYVPGISASYKDTSADYNYFQFTYEIGMRTYLGLDYLFFDFGLRFGIQINTGEGFNSKTSDGGILGKIPGEGNYLPTLHLTFALGGNIPILDWFSLQLIFHTAVGASLFNAVDIGFRVGTTFNNLW